MVEMNAMVPQAPKDNGKSKMSHQDNSKKSTISSTKAPSISNPVLALYKPNVPYPN